MPEESTAQSFRPTISFVSPSARRSECPTITYCTASERSIGRETSPVKAPRSSQNASCAPRRHRDVMRLSAPTNGNQGKGGQSTTVTRSLPLRNSCVSAAVRRSASLRSGGPIFQLAITYFTFFLLVVKLYSCFEETLPRIPAQSSKSRSRLQSRTPPTRKSLEESRDASGNADIKQHDHRAHCE